jgi:hypothetical protein
MSVLGTADFLWLENSCVLAGNTPGTIQKWEVKDFQLTPSETTLYRKEAGQGDRRYI